MNEIGSNRPKLESAYFTVSGSSNLETSSQRRQRFTRLVCLVVFLLTVFTLGLSVLFSIFVSWNLWGGSALASSILVVAAAFSWKMVLIGKTQWAARINIATLATVVAAMYWLTPYFALYLVFLFIMTVVHIILGPGEALGVGIFLFANTLLYSILNHNRIYAPDGQAVTLDYGTFTLWWTLIAGTGWLVSFLYRTMQHDNQTLSIQTAELKEAQEQLVESAGRYRALSQASFEGIVLHEQGIVLEANQTLAEMLGYPLSELTGTSLQELVQTEANSIMKAQPFQEESEPFEALAVRKDQSCFPVESQSRDFVYRGRSVRVSAIRDITIRKQTEEALRHSQLQLLQAQKMESIGRLAGGVAHDFNNLLTAITGYGELMLMNMDEGEALKADLDEILAAADKATSLTRQLLAFSRQQVLQPQLLDLNTVIAQMEKLLRRLIGEDIELTTLLTPELPKVMADRGQIEQVIMNLAINAKDAISAGGQLTLETSNLYLDEDYTSSKPNLTLKSGKYVLLAVTDTGVGMDRATQAHIFEPFFTTKAAGRGTGLGLATTYGIIEQSGGYILVYSVPFVGTTFKIYLPVADQVGEKNEVKEKTASPDILCGAETILVVEDEDMVRQLITRILAKYGYPVLTARNGQEALDLLKENSTSVDLVLTDLIMPQLGGLELVEQLSQSHPTLKIIGMSGYTDRVAAQQNIFKLVKAYVQKPFTPDSLIGKIREVLDAQK